MAGDFSSLIAVVAVCALRVMLLWSRQRHPQGDRPSAPATVKRLLKPRTPDDCHACRRHRNLPHTTAAPPPAVRPWRELQSRRGAPKRIATDGFACPNATGAYYHVTDAQIHALVGAGTHGNHERIQTFRCQACGTTFTSRRDTPRYRLKTPAPRVGEGLTALAEGLDIAAAERVFGHRHATITTWLTRAGEHSAALQQHWFRHLQLPVVAPCRIQLQITSSISLMSIYLWQCPTLLA